VTSPISADHKEVSVTDLFLNLQHDSRREWEADSTIGLLLLLLLLSSSAAAAAASASLFITFMQSIYNDMLYI
jgi:hypothetical protein